MLTFVQAALKNNVDYPTVLGFLRDARQKGLTVPVLLMGQEAHPEARFILISTF